MSQYNFESVVDRQLVQFGFDHACGYFVTVYDADDEPTLAEDSLFDGLTGIGLVERLTEHIDPQAPPELVDAATGATLSLGSIVALAMMDLPF
jgi:hypothetical protein